MRWSDLLSETLLSLSSNKARSFLTILGIVVGIGSVILMVAIGQGSQASIQQSIQATGSNLLMVQPGSGGFGGFGGRGGGAFVRGAAGSSSTLTQADATAIQTQISGISAVAPVVSSNYQIIAKGSNTNTRVYGVTPDYASVRNIQVTDGNFIGAQDARSATKVAVLGPTTRDDLFGAGANAVGQTVRVNGVEFTVVGITVSRGGTGFQNADDAIYVPLTTAQRYLAGGTSLSEIDLQVTDANAATSVQQAVTQLLLQRHKISDPTQADFNVLSQEQMLATVSSVTGTFTLLLASIAGISLFVGGIGIMNMMLTMVTERTREIGLRKAIGARQGDIATQFLAESVMLTFIGGVVGVSAGWGISLLVTRFASIATQVSLSSVLLAFGVSAGIGIVFGYYPARRAAALNPIEALRYQ